MAAPTRERFLEELARWQGYAECREPDHGRRFPSCNGRSNHTRFHDKLGYPGGPAWPWCMIAIVAIARDIGWAEFPKTASTRDLWAWANAGKYGLKVVPRAEARRGDLIEFDWPGGYTPTDHIGVVLEVLGGGWFLTWEANTSPDNNGSQTNGGGIYIRRRNSSIRGFVRPPYADVAHAPPPPPAPTIRLHDEEPAMQIIRPGERHIPVSVPNPATLDYEEVWISFGADLVREDGSPNILRVAPIHQNGDVFPIVEEYQVPRGRVGFAVPAGCGVVAVTSAPGNSPISVLVETRREA